MMQCIGARRPTATQVPPRSHLSVCGAGAGAARSGFAPDDCLRAQNQTIKPQKLKSDAQHAEETVGCLSGPLRSGPTERCRAKRANNEAPANTTGSEPERTALTLEQAPTWDVAQRRPLRSVSRQIAVHWQEKQENARVRGVIVKVL